jgi:toxin HigB-1
MIHSFSDQDTEQLFNDVRVARFQSCEQSARRKLAMLNAASNLSALRVPPGNRLEALQGNRAGQHSIRINDQWRVCFRWIDGHPHDVEICDYH